MKLEDIIVYEDGSFIVVDKPSGLVVNRSETIEDETLQDLISDYLKLDDLGVGDRAGIVHRLDRETSGLLIIAKTASAFENLQKQFKNRTVQKEYVALVHGNVDNVEGVIDSPIGRVGGFGRFGIVQGGRESKTSYVVDQRLHIDEEMFTKLTEDMNRNKVRYLKVHGLSFSLLTLAPKTGRTHQLRVHLKSINKPIVSDKIYGPGRLLSFDLTWCPRLFLHAKSIEFTHPETGKDMFFDSELPEDLKGAMLKLEII
jgi:23S rRNA pseudouridine1911/1915/1917 synthase